MFQFSLRQLLISMAVLALAVTSLRYASLFWQNIIGLFALLTTFWALLFAIFGRGPRQAFAIGFSVATIGYALLVDSGDFDGTLHIANIELVASKGKLPTTILLYRLYQTLDHPVYFDRVTGEPVRRATAEAILKGHREGVELGTVFSKPPIISRQEPTEDTFTPIGHDWWGMLFGFFAGSLAFFIKTSVLPRIRKALLATK